MLGICLIGSLWSLVLCTWSGEQRAESMEAMRNDVPVRRRSAISQKEVVVVVGGPRWLEEASHSGSTGSA